MRVILALASAAVLLGGCDQFADAKNAVRRNLTDPASAQFRDLQRCPAGEGATGDVNAKNQFGGYVGFKPFIFVDGKLALSGDGTGSFADSLKLCYGEFAAGVSENAAQEASNAASQAPSRRGAE